MAVTVGTGATNPLNGNAWADPNGFTKPANAVGTVTTTLTAGSGNGATPQTFTYNVVDSVFGVDFDFDVIFTAFSNESGSYEETRRRAGAVDGPTNNENRNRTEFLADNGSSEFARTAIDPSSITVNSPGFDVSFLRWDQVNLVSVDNGVEGEIRASGATNDPGTGSSLLDFDSAGIFSLVPDATTSIDWVPTAGAADNGFQARGFVMAFDVTANIPEPSRASLLGLATVFCLLHRRRP